MPEVWDTVRKCGLGLTKWRHVLNLRKEPDFTCTNVHRQNKASNARTQTDKPSLDTLSEHIQIVINSNLDVND